MKIKPIIAAEMKKLFYLDSSIPHGLRWAEERKNFIKIGDPAGRLNQSGYYEVMVCGKLFKTHRIIYSIYYNVNLTNQIIDHIDRCSQNNHPSNLRVASQAENGRNRTKKNNVSSKYNGVSWRKESSKWHSQICVNKKKIHIGLFSSELDAARAFNNYIITHNLSYFNLNEI